MYYADPADEGESFSGFFIPTLSLAFLFFLLSSCHNHRQRLTLVESVTAKDSATVIIKKTPPPPPVKPVKKKKKIYLTFDDGPNKGTRNVLDIVQQEDIPVTFFIVGEHVFASPGQSQVWDSLKMAKNIELCNHSYSHAHNHYEKFYQQPDSVVKDIQRANDELMPENTVVRTPGRNSWRIDSIRFTDIKKSIAAVDSLEKAGFTVFGWDLEWHYDHKSLEVTSTADELVTQIDSMFSKGKTKTKDNLVVLAHDQVYHKSGDSIQLRELIRKLKLKEDYEFALASSYPGVKKENYSDTLHTAP